MASNKWTPEQLEAIKKEGTNIIVSAGAGSGKTAVLSQRVLRKLKEGIDIRDILILTFTNEAAGEMKKRIREEMEKEGLTDQLEYIDTAYITTFDAYALNLVKKYHYLFNISRNITLIDNSIIELEKEKILEDIFLDYYDKKDPRFLKLIGDFTTRDDKKIKTAILKINKSLDLKYDKESFLKNYIENYFQEGYIDILFDEYFNYLKNICASLEENLYALESLVSKDQYDAYANAFKYLIRPKNYEALREAKYEWPRKIVPEEAKPIREMLKDNFNSLKEMTIYSEKELRGQIRSTLDYVTIIIDIILKLDARINEYKIKQEAFEFIDISKMAIKIVEENEEIREDLKNSFNEIMIDEYQDTNDLQELFIQFIASNNVYMVGDIKQSIYRFRNANPNIFKEKYENYKKGLGGIAIDLTKNFRSRNEVLEDINKIFNVIMTEYTGDVNYGDNHAMKFGNQAYNEVGSTNYDHHMKLLKYPSGNLDYTNSEIEAFIIAQDIRKKVKEEYQIYDFKENKKRNIEYADFCIILDRNTEMATYKKIFEYLNIPMEVYQDKDLVNDAEILLFKNIIGLILAIHKKDEYSKMRYYFTSIARSYIGNLTDAEILDALNEKTFYNTDIYKTCNKLASNLEVNTPNKLMNEIIEGFHFYEHLIESGSVEDAMVRIDYLLDLTLNMEDLGFTIEDLGSFLENILETKKDLRYHEVKGNANCVKIMNIHKSKGLEFPICYFAGLTKAFNLKELNDRFMFDSTYGILTPFYKEGIGTLFTKTLIKNKYLQNEISEKVRLFYVALTRAKENIIIVLPEFKELKTIKGHVDYLTGMIYRSFYDFLESMSSNLASYSTNISISDLNLTHNYDKLKKEMNLELEERNDKISFIENNIDFHKIEDKHASKTMKEIITEKEQATLEFGTKMHYMLEMTNFKEVKTDNPYINNLLKTFDFQNAIIYQELEFIFTSDDIEYHGIIDLMLEFDDKIQIIDYKLKNIDDENYIKQLEVYKEYISSISNKKTELYLYSIMENKVKKIELSVEPV